ncbi:MAG: RimK family alpha-L-glutamate ligase [Roseiarcus sp.]|jgi:tetrahydromethanopterin:alpha-L-glutamate ligase
MRKKGLADHSLGLRIALAVDKIDWHAREIARAMSSLGARAIPFRLSAARFDTNATFGLNIRGFGSDLPDAVIVRTISGGTFQAVTMRLGILHALRELGVLVWNDARAIERCVDKSTTSFLLDRAGIPTPATWAVESITAARGIVQREARHGPLVLKPLFGSQGRGLQLIRAAEDLPSPETTAGVYYLQRFVGVEREGFRDLRILVSRGRVVAAMVRHADSWITNIKQGGRPVATVPDAEVKALAIAAAGVVGAELAGVDIIRDADGRPYVLEVNSMPAWRGLQKVTSFNIAGLIVRDLLAALEPTARQREAM